MSRYVVLALDGLACVRCAYARLSIVGLDQSCGLYCRTLDVVVLEFLQSTGSGIIGKYLEGGCFRAIFLTCTSCLRGSVCSGLLVRLNHVTKCVAIQQRACDC